MALFIHSTSFHKTKNNRKNVFMYTEEDVRNILRKFTSQVIINNNNNNLLLIQRKYLYEYIQMRLTSYIKIILK